MTRKKIVIFEIDGGKVAPTTKGFAGKECLSEFEEIALRLRELGIELETEKVVLLQEYFREVERRNVRVGSGSGRA